MSKGKATSDTTRHTGQGIFFTSKVLDTFTLAANGVEWSIDNPRSDQALGRSTVSQGTRVTGTFTDPPREPLADVFRRFTDDDLGFSRTRTPVSLAEMGSAFVSRSEAKLILGRLEAFTDVELDFSGVNSVGQAFVDEVFRVWPSVHPNTTITPVNMNEAVEFMVRRGLAEPR